MVEVISLFISLYLALTPVNARCDVSAGALGPGVPAVGYICKLGSPPIVVVGLIYTDLSVVTMKENY